MLITEKETIKINNKITIAEVDNFDTVRNFLSAGKRLSELAGLKVLGEFTNTVGDWFKKQEAISSWDQAIEMHITDLKTSPSASETVVTGNIIYIATASLVLTRIKDNPYYLCFGIEDVDGSGRSGDGVWGSVSLVDSSGRQLNRLNSPITKASNKKIIVEFELQNI